MTGVLMIPGLKISIPRVFLFSVPPVLGDGFFHQPGWTELRGDVTAQALLAQECWFWLVGWLEVFHLINPGWKDILFVCGETLQGTFFFHVLNRFFLLVGDWLTFRPLKQELFCFTYLFFGNRNSCSNGETEKNRVNDDTWFLNSPRRYLICEAIRSCRGNFASHPFSGHSSGLLLWRPRCSKGHPSRTSLGHQSSGCRW